MRRVADREAAFDAGMAVIGVAVLVRHHAHELLALHLGAERAADAAIGAGRDRAVLGRAYREQRFLDQRAGRTGLHAGAARDALRIHERIVLARGDLRQESAALDRQRERALLLVAGAHAARADDALRGIEAEIRIRFVDRVAREKRIRSRRRQFLRMHVVGAVEAVAHIGRGRRPWPCPRFRCGRRPARDRGERMIGKIKLHHAAAQLAELRRSASSPSCRPRPASCTRPENLSCLRSAPGRAGTSRTRRAVPSRRASESGCRSRMRRAAPTCPRGRGRRAPSIVSATVFGRCRFRRAEIGFSYGTHVETPARGPRYFLLAIA